MYGDGYTPLHVAAMKGSTDGVRVLLRLLADSEVLDDEWMTAEQEAQEVEILTVCCCCKTTILLACN